MTEDNEGETTLTAEYKYVCITAQNCLQYTSMMTWLNYELMGFVKQLGQKNQST